MLVSEYQEYRVHDPSLRRRIIMVFMLLIIGVMPTLAGGRRERSIPGGLASRESLEYQQPVCTVEITPT